MRKLIVLLATTVALVGTVVGVAIADPGLELQASPHRHFINGREVGPNYCDNPNLKGPFTQFHANVHSHNFVTGEIGPDTPAPGLHKQQPFKIQAGAC